MSFKCVKCNQTWPDKENQADPEETKYGTGICPNCYDEDDDDDDHPNRSINSFPT